MTGSDSRCMERVVKKKKMKESFNTITNLINLISTELIINGKIKAKQLTDLQLFSHIKKYT